MTARRTFVHRALDPEGLFPKPAPLVISALHLPRLRPGEEPGARAMRLLVRAVCKACHPRQTMPTMPTPGASNEP